MIARYFVSVTLGSAVTFSLLFLMQHLISTGEEVVTPPLPPPVDYVWKKRFVEPKPVRSLPRPPDERELPPPTKFPPYDGDPTDGPVVRILGPTPPVIGLGAGPVTGYAQSGDLLPIVAVAPAYPARALARHLEGYVVVEYTVTVTGGVRDAFVVASSSSIFDQSALEAAYKFKYKPRVVDGQPVEVPGVRRKFSFVLEG